MILNRLFLGSNSVVNIETHETVNEIKLKLGSRYTNIKDKPKSNFSFDREDFSTNYVYTINDNELTIYFAKELNRKWRHSFQAAYPSFNGQIIENGSTRILKGNIGFPEWRYYLVLLWFSFFSYTYIGWSIKGETTFPDGEIAIYFILFGLLGIIVGLLGLNKKVREMKEEIEGLFS